MMNDLILVSGGQCYTGWQEIEVTTGMDRLAGSFSLSVPDGAWSQVPLDAGDACEIYLGDHRLIRGHLDEVTIDMGLQRTTVRINGRDATADLVDCAAVPAQIKGRDLLQIAKALCGPFGIPVSAQVPFGEPLKTFTIETGETVHESLERLARIRGVLFVSDGDSLTVTQARTGNVTDALIQGINIESAQVKSDWRDRFSRYTVMAQSDGDAGTAFSLTQQAKGVATDPDIDRYRPTIIQAEESIDSDTLQLRARWEAQVRTGRARRLQVVTTGWLTCGGQPWAFNRLVEVNAPTIGVTANLLIEGVAFNLSDRGRTTRLTLIDPDAYARVALGEPTTGLFG